LLRYYRQINNHSCIEYVQLVLYFGPSLKITFLECYLLRLYYNILFFKSLVDYLYEVINILNGLFNILIIFILLSLTKKYWILLELHIYLFRITNIWLEFHKPKYMVHTFNKFSITVIILYETPYLHKEIKVLL